jgi:hypothetical protein
MHHAALNRAGPNDRGFDDQVIEAARRQARQHIHLRARFDLKHAERIALAQHVVHLWAFSRYVLQLQRPDIRV